MGLFKNYINQTRKPEGFLGKMMIKGMNSGHAKMADWGMSHLQVTAPKESLHILNALEVSADMVLCDVLKTGYNVKSSVFSEKISALPKNEQERIYNVVDTLIRHAQ